MHWWNLSRLQNTWMMYLHGNKETIDFTPLDMVIPSTEGEVEEEVEVEEDKSGFKRDKWRDQMEDLEEDSLRGNGIEVQQAPTDRPQTDRQGDRLVYAHKHRKKRKWYREA